MNKTDKNEVFDKDYLNDLQEIKSTIRVNQNKAIVIVNSAMIMTYYEIGTIINKHKTWGSKYIQKLSMDLKEYGKGYSVRNLQFMMRFANEFSRDEIMHQVGAQIPWRTIVEIISKSKSHNEIVWYIKQTHKNSWSRSVVLKQFEHNAYELNSIEPTASFEIKSNNNLNELFKDTYILDFLNNSTITKEIDLKNSLLNNVIEFLHELGPGFALIDKEYKLVTPTNKTFYIDLLMYHTKIHCYIVIELKIGEFEPSDLGQLSFYVNAINKLEKTNIDDETIGLLLCKSADRFVAETTLETSNMKLGISKYKMINDITKHLEDKLNEKEKVITTK